MKYIINKVINGNKKIYQLLTKAENDEIILSRYDHV